MEENMNEKIIILRSSETHTYTLDGRVIPNVTRIIAETVGTGWKAADWYLQRGRAIHACAALIAEGKEFKYDDRLAGYVTALKKFFAEVKPENVKSELRVVSKIYQYAGTIDLIGKIGRRNVILDWKHSVDRNRIELQIGGYAIAARETIGIEYGFGAGVQIKENGTYSMGEIFPLMIPACEFLALRTTYRIRERCGELTT
jgi:hypothetical protein